MPPITHGQRAIGLTDCFRPAGRSMESQRLLHSYNGHEQEIFVIRSCFGGVGHSFVASGSEDARVHIWHVASERLLARLEGHQGTVNGVAWNPVNHQQLASASDDGTVRLWGPCRDDNDDETATNNSETPSLNANRRSTSAMDGGSLTDVVVPVDE